MQGTGGRHRRVVVGVFIGGAIENNCCICLRCCVQIAVVFMRRRTLIKQTNHQFLRSIELQLYLSDKYFAVKMSLSCDILEVAVHPLALGAYAVGVRVVLIAAGAFLVLIGDSSYSIAVPLAILCTVSWQLNGGYV